MTASSRRESNHSSLDSSSMMTKNPDSAAVIANQHRLAGKREREMDVSAPSSPTHSQSTVEVDLCDEEEEEDDEEGNNDSASVSTYVIDEDDFDKDHQLIERAY